MNRKYAGESSFPSSLSYYRECNPFIFVTGFIPQPEPYTNSLLVDTVEEEAVGGVGAGVANGGLSELLDSVADRTGFDVLEADQVSTDTSNVGGGHGGSRHGFVATTGDNGDNLVTRSVDVNCRGSID